jgi:hypothetical protein
MNRTAREDNMMGGVSALALLILAACLGGFALTALAGWLSLEALQMIGTPRSPHWVAVSAFFVVTLAIAYGRTGMMKAR